MEWDPNERDAWVADAQRWIQQIKGVLQCKIDLDSEGEISGVHVVSGMDREPRHIVRDVESLLKARLDIDVFYKKIGVVQVLDNGNATDEEPDTDKPAPAAPVVPPADPIPEKVATPSGVTFHPEDDPLHETPVVPQASDDPDPATVLSGEDAGAPSAPGAPVPAVLVEENDHLRVVCSGVGVMASDRLVRAEVQLRAGELEVRGTAEGPNHGGSAIQLVAQATLKTLNRMVDFPLLLHLQEVRRETTAGQELILVAVEVVEGRRSETLFGCCGKRHNEQQAVVFAILDALNRKLSLYPLHRAEAEG